MAGVSALRAPAHVSLGAEIPLPFAMIGCFWPIAEV